MWQLSKANRLKMFGYYNWDTHLPGEGGKALLTNVSYIFMKTLCVCVCVCFEANDFIKIYLGVLCFVYMYSMCICAISDFVFKRDYLWFYVCKVALIRMWFFFLFCSQMWSKQDFVCKLELRRNPMLSILRHFSFYVHLLYFSTLLKKSIRLVNN